MESGYDIELGLDGYGVAVGIEGFNQDLNSTGICDRGIIGCARRDDQESCYREVEDGLVLVLKEL